MFESESSLIETGCGFSKKAAAREAGMEAARRALESIGRYPVSVVMVFASVRFDPEALIEGIRSAAGPVPIIGASSAGEICDGSQEESVVVAALASPYLKVHSAVGRNVSADWRAAVAEAADSPYIRPFFSPPGPAGDAFRKNLRREGKSVFGLLFLPGATRVHDARSRDILQTLLERSRRLIPFCGGNSADDFRFEKNHVFHNGRVYRDGMIVAIFETQLQNGMGVAHGFSPSGGKMLVTRARENVILEIDHRPADQAFSELAGKPLPELEGKHLTLATGRPFGFQDPYGEFTINVASFFMENGGLKFSQPVVEGAQLTLMDADPESMVAAGKQALQKAMFRGGISQPAFALVFSCALRHHILNERTAEEIDGIRGLSGDARVAGFLSFGEQGLADNGVNCHGNELVSVLAIGRHLTPAAEVWFENRQLLKAKENAEKALVAANAFRQAVIEHIAEGLCVFHEIDRYPFIQFDIWNGRMTEITGYHMEEINRLRWDPLGLPNPEIQEKARAVVARLRGGDHLRGEEWEITAKDGTKRTVAVSTNAIVLKDDQVHVLAVLYGLGRQKQAESERLALERRSQRLAKIESLGAMAGGIAHDFNNILMVILGNIELAMTEAPESTPLRNHLQEMEKSVFIAADLTRKLLSYTGKTQFVITAVDLGKLVKKAARSLAGSLPPSVKLQVRPAPKLPMARADAGKVSQVIVNLVTNAAEAYGPEKGGRITIATGTQHCSAEDLAHTAGEVMGSGGHPPEGRYVFLEVADHAGGMDEKAARRVFDPFYTTKFPGRGLGMSTVLGVVRGLGGAIRLDSVLGAGTTIRVLLPAVEEEAPVLACGGADPPNGGTCRELRTILLVDDEAKIRNLAKTMLERLGYRVLPAEDGPEAIRIYQENYRDIYCVLLDLTMPKMNGREIYRKLRSLDPGVCVILSSGYTEQDVMAQFKDEQPAGFVQKPYRIQMLGRKLKAILEAVEAGRCAHPNP